jgi:hypothetical protein
MVVEGAILDRRPAAFGGILARVRIALPVAMAII